MSEDTQTAVVLRYRDGRTLRCTLEGEFRPRDQDEISTVTEDGTQVKAALDELKAVFFLKNPRQRAAELQLGERSGIPENTAAARVEFVDGEIVRGQVHVYSLADRGFFLYPTAVESNNDRIFVLASALNTLAMED